jgi:hypothetical protein
MVKNVYMGLGFLILIPSSLSLTPWLGEGFLICLSPTFLIHKTRGSDNAHLVVWLWRLNVFVHVKCLEQLLAQNKKQITIVLLLAYYIEIYSILYINMNLNYQITKRNTDSWGFKELYLPLVHFRENNIPTI